MTETHIGLLVLGLPLLLIGGIVLNRWRPVQLMYLVALVIGLGYLTTTGAVDDIGREAKSYISAPEPAPAPTP